MTTEQNSVIGRARSGLYTISLVLMLNNGTWIVFGEFHGNGQETDSLHGIVHFGASQSKSNAELLINEDKMLLNISHHRFEITEIDGQITCKYGSSPAEIRVFINTV